MKYLITESQIDRATDSFLTRLLEPHEEKEYPKSNAKVWIKDGEEIVLIKGGFFLLNKRIWDLFSEMFSLNYDETQSYIKKWLEEHYNLGELTPFFFILHDLIWLEEHYNLGELTPYGGWWSSSEELEEHYK